MSIRGVFGRLLWNVGEKLKSWSEQPTTEVTGTVKPTAAKTLVWGVEEGPFGRDDLPEDELEEIGIPEDWNWMIVAKVSEGDKVGYVNLWYDTLDEAYAVVKHFKTSIEPLELDDGQEE
jgi:hypothetical protein